MNSLKTSGRLLTALVLLVASASLQAQNSVRYKAQPASHVKIEGTSTLHDWTVEGQIIAGVAELDASIPVDPESTASPKPGKVNAKVDVSIPVRSLKSGKQLMDGIMQDAMNMKEHKDIQYHVSELVFKERSGKNLIFDSTGELTVAGEKKAIQMPVTFEAVSKIRLRISGKTALKMTDFKIKPPAPSIAGGLIKTGDDVTVTFAWVVKADEAQK